MASYQACVQYMCPVSENSTLLWCRFLHSHSHKITHTHTHTHLRVNSMRAVRYSRADARKEGSLRWRTSVSWVTCVWLCVCVWVCECACVRVCVCVCVCVSVCAGKPMEGIPDHRRKKWTEAYARVFKHGSN